MPRSGFGTPQAEQPKAQCTLLAIRQPITICIRKLRIRAQLLLLEEHESVSIEVRIIDQWVKPLGNLIAVR